MKREAPCEKPPLGLESNMGLPRCEADVYPIPPFGHGRSSLEFDSGCVGERLVF